MKILNITKSFINNQWQSSQSTRSFEVKDKYANEKLAEIYYAEASDIEFAISSSVNAFNLYKKTTGAYKNELLLKIKEEILKNKDDFINLLVKEAGKPIDLAKAEFDRSMFILEQSASEALRITGEVVPMEIGLGVGRIAHTKKFPIGPVLAIAPFNFPLNLVLHKVAPALAAGCSVILKPSAYTPMISLLLAKVFMEAGVPDGLFNVVICENKEAQLMIEDDRLKMLSFTGSDKVGWELKSKAGKKRVTLELGGNAAVIVDEGLNIDDVVKNIVSGSYSFAGQVCISVQRIFVHKSYKNIIEDKLISEIKKIKVGNPNEVGVLVGPMIEDKHAQRIDNWLKEALEQGAKVLIGGDYADKTHNVYAPTLVTSTTHSMKIVSEEAFAPIAVLEYFDNFSDVINEVNSSRYGLQAGLFSNNLKHMKQAFEEIEVGALIMNSVPGFRIDSMPYGGVKDSGLGKEGVKYAIEDMLESRLLVY